MLSKGRLRFLPVADQCGAILTSPVGLITSPNYPEPYPTNEECNTTIRVTKGPIKVAFQAFDVGNLKYVLKLRLFHFSKIQLVVYINAAF